MSVWKRSLYHHSTPKIRVIKILCQGDIKKAMENIVFVLNLKFQTEKIQIFTF